MLPVKIQITIEQVFRSINPLRFLLQLQKLIVPEANIAYDDELSMKITVETRNTGASVKMLTANRYTLAFWASLSLQFALT